MQYFINTSIGIAHCIDSNAFEGTLIFQVFRLRNSVEIRIEKVYY